MVQENSDVADVYRSKIAKTESVGTIECQVIDSEI